MYSITVSPLRGKKNCERVFWLSSNYSDISARIGLSPGDIKLPNNATDTEIYTFCVGKCSIWRRRQAWARYLINKVLILTKNVIFSVSQNIEKDVENLFLEYDYSPVERLGSKEN